MTERIRTWQRRRSRIPSVVPDAVRELVGLGHTRQEAITLIEIEAAGMGGSHLNDRDIEQAAWRALRLERDG